MSKHRNPSITINREIGEVTIRKGEILSTNLMNHEENTALHYSHVELWVTPKGEKIVFIPEGVKVETYDNWDDQYKKNFKAGDSK